MLDVPIEDRRPSLRTPEEMTARIERWRQENLRLRAYADRCEDKTLERLVVEMPAAHRPSEYAVDRDRIFSYLKKRRAIVRLSLSDRFCSLPFLPTPFDRTYARARRLAVDYYADLRELTPLSLVERTSMAETRREIVTSETSPAVRRFEIARIAS